MNIRDLRIGDKVCTKNGFPMVVVGMFTTKYQLDNPESGSAYLDFDGNEGDVFEEDVKDLQPCNKQTQKR